MLKELFHKASIVAERMICSEGALIIIGRSRLFNDESRRFVDVQSVSLCVPLHSFAGGGSGHHKRQRCRPFYDVTSSSTMFSRPFRVVLEFDHESKYFPSRDTGCRFAVEASNRRVGRSQAVTHALESPANSKLLY